MRPGSGWTRLSTAEQIAAKVELIDALRDAVDLTTVRRWRAEVLRPVVDRCYAKANKGRPDREGRTDQGAAAGGRGILSLLADSDMAG